MLVVLFGAFVFHVSVGLCLGPVSVALVAGGLPRFALNATRAISPLYVADWCREGVRHVAPKAE